MEKKDSKKKTILSFVLKFLGLSLFLIFSLFFLAQANSVTRKKSDSNKEVKLPEIYTDSKGFPALSTGNCATTSDCFPTGCSSQICANHELVTTCELGNFPEKETYSCGCIENRCVWYRDR